MKHISMLPPQEEPAYRKRHNERLKRWREAEAFWVKPQRQHEMHRYVLETKENWRSAAEQGEPV